MNASRDHEADKSVSLTVTAAEAPAAQFGAIGAFGGGR